MTIDLVTDCVDFVCLSLEKWLNYVVLLSLIYVCVCVCVCECVCV